MASLPESQAHVFHGLFWVRREPSNLVDDFPVSAQPTNARPCTVILELDVTVGWREFPSRSR